MFTRIVSSVSNALDFNLATLSGCIDIVVVPDEDGQLHSTPFHVRFGKTKVLRSREKHVSITVNGRLTDLGMHLGSAGEAYFHITDAEDDREIKRKLTKAPTPMNQQPPAALPIITHQRSESPSQLPSPQSKIQMSLCGHLLIGLKEEAQHDRDVFLANLVNWNALEADPGLWFHPSLVFKFGSESPYLPSRVALPLISSWAVFNKSISRNAFATLLQSRLRFKDANDLIENLQINMQEMLHRQPQPLPMTLPEDTTYGSSPANLRSPGMPGLPSPTSTPSTVSSWKNYFPGGPGILASCCSPATAGEDHTALIVTRDEEQSPPDSAINVSTEEYSKRLKPTSEQLASLHLKPGANKITFSVSTALQGYRSVSGTVYLWPRNSKIIISDVDGTITKSDLWGQLMPIVGGDWSHEGVAELFTNIRKRGYRIVYLTARAIGQADATRDYLFGLTQGDDNCQLPDGPLILSPDRLFPSFKREVIDRKPFVFKIAALRDLRTLFPSYYNPFYAGFGNRDTDHRAYVHVGVPEARIFIVDPTGHVHHVNRTFAKTYSSMTSMVNEMFPPLKRNAALPPDDDDDDDDAWSGSDDSLRNSKRLVVKEPLRRYLSPVTPLKVDPYSYPLEKHRNPISPSPGVTVEQGPINRPRTLSARIRNALRS